MESDSRGLRHRLALAAAAAALVVVRGVIGIAANVRTKTTTTTKVVATTPVETAAIDPHVAAGAQDFVQFACNQCHGFPGEGRHLTAPSSPRRRSRT